MKRSKLPKAVVDNCRRDGGVSVRGDVMAQNGSSDVAHHFKRRPNGLSPGVSRSKRSVLRRAQSWRNFAGEDWRHNHRRLHFRNTGDHLQFERVRNCLFETAGIFRWLITTMLNQRQRVTLAAVQTSQPGSAEVSTAVAQPTVAHVQSVPPPRRFM